jgi:hypothetical protein
VRAVGVQHRQPGEQLGVQPVGLAVLGVVPRQSRRARRRNQDDAGPRGAGTKRRAAPMRCALAPSPPAPRPDRCLREAWSTDRPGSAATCGTWPVQMDRPAHRRRLTWCAAQHAISMPRRTGLANSIRRLPGTVDLFSYRARQPAALPGRRTGPPSRRRWSSVPASASRRSSWAEGSDPRSLGVVNMLTVALCGRVVVQLRLACRPLSPLPP